MGVFKVSDNLNYYVNCFSDEKDKGIAYIDFLTDGQIAILCNIIETITKEKITTPSKDVIKEFTLNSNKDIFKKYVKHIAYSFDDLMIV